MRGLRQVASPPAHLRAASSIWTGYPARNAATVEGGVMTLALPREGRRLRPWYPSAVHEAR